MVLKDHGFCECGFSAFPKETSGHYFADHWGENHGRLDRINPSLKPFIFNHEFNESSRIFFLVPTTLIRIRVIRGLKKSFIKIRG
jgi:hypothetical protein